MALIIDAPMPKNCLSCPSKEHCLAFGKLHFNERLKMLDECRRADNCPIIGEIPDSHGRIIDADAEIAKLEAFMKVLNKETEIGGRQYHECDCVLHYLTDAPVIVEASNG